MLEAYLEAELRAMEAANWEPVDACVVGCKVPARNCRRSENVLGYCRPQPNGLAAEAPRENPRLEACAGSSLQEWDFGCLKFTS